LVKVATNPQRLGSRTSTVANLRHAVKSELGGHLKLAHARLNTPRRVDQRASKITDDGRGFAQASSAEILVDHSARALLETNALLPKGDAPLKM
jgi:hypothetical protein